MTISGLLSRRTNRSMRTSIIESPPGASDLDLAALGVISTAPIWMTHAERLLLFTLTFSLRPSRYLEIGTLKGGSALIVCSAMDALNGVGKIACVDPRPQIAPETWDRIKHRASVITGFSPDALPEARDAAGGSFDLILIDGDHTRDGVIRDAEGVLPFAAKGAKILFHDCHNADVRMGIDEFAADHKRRLIDSGPMTSEALIQVCDDGSRVNWGGLRLIEVKR